MQRQRQQYQKNFSSDRQLEENQCLTDFRYQTNRRRQEGPNSARQRHENGGLNRNDRCYPRYRPPPTNGFAPKSEPNLRGTTSRRSFRQPFCPTPQNGGPVVCPPQQMQQTCTMQTIMNTSPSHLQFTQLQQTQTISGIPANLMGFPCYTILVPPQPIVNPVPSVMQPPLPPHYSDYNLPPNIHAEMQSQKIFLPLIATAPPTQRVIQQTPLPARYNKKPSPKKRDHALAIIDPVTHRDIFDSKREQSATDQIATNSSTGSSRDDLKCASKYVEARPDQIQAAVDAQEHSGDIKDLQSLNFIDLMQHHNISAALPEDEDPVDDEQDDAQDDAKDDDEVDAEDNAKGDVKDDMKGTVAESTQQEHSGVGSLIACLLDISSDAPEESDGAQADNHDDSNDEPAPGSSLCAKKQFSSMSSLLSDISSASSVLAAELDLVFSEIFPNAARGSYKLKPEVMNLEVPFRVSDEKRHRYTKRDLMVLRYAPACLDAPSINRDASCFLRKETPTAQRPTPMQPHYCHQNVTRNRYHGGRISRRQSCSTLHNSEGNQNVKLNEVSNAWRPKKLRKRTDLPPDQQAAEEVFQKVRSLLNKLTKEKLDLLVNQLLALTIDTGDKINGIMLLIFEKAIDELHFSQSYAMLCLRLIENQLHVRKETNSDQPNFIMFKQTLLDKAQEEFNTNVVDQTSKREKLKPILDQLEQCRDEEKKAELKALHYDQEKRLRRRSVGTVKFIGELYRVGILTNSIIGKCIRSLLDPDCEDKLECLSKLLTTVGEKYETALAQRGIKGNLDDVFEQIEKIILCKKTSSRVRFMLQDLTDARQKWLDKLGPSSPTKPSTPNPDRMKAPRRPQDQHPPLHQKRKNGGESVAQKRTNPRSVPVLIKQTLKHNTNRKTSPVVGLVRSIHHYTETVTVRRTQVDERITCEILDVVSGESSVSLAHESHESHETNVIKIVSTALEDGLNEALTMIKNIPSESLSDIIYTILSSYLHLVQTKTPHRLEAAQIVLESIKRGLMTRENLLQGYNRFAEEISDIIIDVPDVWSYIFEFLGPIIESGQLNVRLLWNDSLKNASMGKKFLKHFLQHYVVTHRHGIVRKLWSDSELKFTDFLPEEEVAGFVEENQFEFVGGNDTAKMSDDKKVKKFTIDQILETVKEKMNFEKQRPIVEFLNETVPTRRVDRKFVNMLTNTIVTSSLKRIKNFLCLDHMKFISVGIPVLMNFIKNTSFEMEVLFAIEWLVKNSQCPPGQLVRIFCALHSTDLIQKDTFLKWRSTRDSYMMRILSAKGMSTFYQNLQEGDFSAANQRLN